MDKDQIRFKWLVFDWFERTIQMKIIEGTENAGGYERDLKITFELFSELVDTSKLRQFIKKT